MKRDALVFDRPDTLIATRPATERGLSKEDTRLLVTTPSGHQHSQFKNLADFLQAGDVLVVNQSATIPASLPATSSNREFRLNLSTNYGCGLWLAEPRQSIAEPQGVTIQRGQQITVGDVTGRMIAPYPNLNRLWFVQFDGDITETIASIGEPIRYAYVDQPYSLEHYQTVFAKVAGSAEMPSAGYPVTENVVASLQSKRIHIADITLHTGVSSLEVEVDDIESHTLYPEPFAVPQTTADLIHQAKADNRRVVALGTTVVRALESAWDGEQVQAMSGFTRLYIHPKVGVNVVDGLITGLHDPVTSHLAMLYTIAGQARIQEAYQLAIDESYLWHEFGDSHLILTR